MKDQTHQYGDKPVSDEYRAQMEATMRALDSFFNGEGVKGTDRKNAIVVMVFPFGDAPDGRVNFMSNGVDRADMVALFKEMIARFQGMPEARGNA